MKNQFRGGIALKRRGGLDLDSLLIYGGGGIGKKEVGVFERGLIPQCTLL